MLDHEYYNAVRDDNPHDDEPVSPSPTIPVAVMSAIVIVSLIWMCW